jgi:hypothetical protein
VLRVAGGDVLTTDGPFAESKEHLAGFYMIDARISTPRLAGRRR